MPGRGQRHVVAVRDGKVTVGPPATAPSRSSPRSSGHRARARRRDRRPLAGQGRHRQAWNATDQSSVGRRLGAVGDRQRQPVGRRRSVRRDRRRSAPAPPRRQASEPELQAWADGRLLKDRRPGPGRCASRGSAASPRRRRRGGGIGERFAGKQYVAGVRHTFADGNWETDVAFGLSRDPPPPIPSPAPGRPLPRNGLQIGIVALQDDPAAKTGSRCASRSSATPRRVCGRARHARRRRPAGHVLPARDRRRGGRRASSTATRFPVVLGQCHSSAKRPRPAAEDDNHVKGYQSRSKMKLTFDDDKKVVILEPPAATSSPCPTTPRPSAGRPERQQGHPRRRRDHARAPRT